LKASLLNNNPLKVIAGSSKMKKRTVRYRTLPVASLLVAAFFFLPFKSWCQADKKTVPNGTDGLVLVIPPDDSLVKKLPANEFNGHYSTLKIGLGYIGDYAAFKLSDEFKQQMDSAGLTFDNKYETRDFRLMFSGALKTKRAITWKFAYMYDGDEKKWMIRETGVTIGVPELAGHIFIGRTKEGYSMIKVMNGHSGVTAERQMALDVIPILADGIKWFGYLPKPRIFWNLGYYNDFVSKDQGFSTYAWQYVARVGWLPYYDKEKNKVLHIAANLRYGKPLDGKITLKSRPESNPAPQIINTGSFQSDHSSHIGAELYYSNSKLLIGSEVMMHNFQSEKGEDHQFVGGDVAVSYLFGGTRPYTTVGSIFGFVKVQKPVFKGGWGAWEAVLRLSSLDLDDGSIQGGKLWRITPMVNWYLTKVARLEFIYGYGVLDRYNLNGSLQIFQARLQLSIL
jgi:phosphate-selective porin OprO/OprP